MLDMEKVLQRADRQQLRIVCDEEIKDNYYQSYEAFYFGFLKEYISFCMREKVKAKDK